MTTGCNLSQRLVGVRLPSVTLMATDGSDIDLSVQTGCTVVYAYPRTSPADGAAIPGWAEIPGAKGCTPQSCGYRDYHQQLNEAGADRVFGLSTQDTEYQREVRDRLHLPFEILSDENLKLQTALSLPTFEAGGMILLERFAMVLRDGQVSRVFHPIANPAGNAETVLNYLTTGD
ncbi:peroxiredoxin [Ruegeria lacuscaerulensis]|uniref:peroxiredoxin n=1 Tax=Ruegeria lacuscaerulensis TaxID=55218 RepID=UPI00147EDAC7|nr:peroxiredoxin [Ruegeria lacuscaerulensis]